ncbi:MAG: O-acetylhomoserine aminocarboxypropyltransferase/cysteine synthase [Bacteroidales bacterium]|nr:O-acetylhomoserine aminocarboxypropyltransferase/cysteine synthase [Bacteroidales bacterium]
MSNYKFDTLQVRAGQEPDPTTGACITPIYQTSAYAFRDVEHGKSLFELKEAGNIYSRLGNPTAEVLENRVAALEGGTAAVSASSGMSAQFLAISSICNAGDNIISSMALYGGTFNQFKVTLPKLGINIKMSKCTDAQEVESLIDENTKAIYVETIANSDFSVPDFEMLSNICKKHKILFIVDNTFGCAGYVCSPAELGANIICHSATKYIGGHGNSLAGMVVDCGNFDWFASGKYPQLTEPCASYHNIKFAEHFGNTAFAAYVRCVGLRDFGCCLSPFNAFLILTGCETLSLRCQRVCDNTLALAKWLEKHPKVSRVNYPGLESHPSHANALKYLKNGFGGVLTVDLDASREDTGRFVNNLKLYTLLTNLGDNRSLISHPATTTHGQLSDEELLSIGITPGTLRISLGIEDIEDLIADFQQALDSIG